jgi:mRNA interferase MazF
LLKAGDVVVVSFPGAEETKVRPAVVLSSETYHKHRPDVIVGLLTGQVQKAIAPTDYVLNDWVSAGLRCPSAFRAYIVTVTYDSGKYVGRLGAEDWRGVQECVQRALDVSMANQRNSEEA